MKQEKKIKDKLLFGSGKPMRSLFIVKMLQVPFLLNKIIKMFATSLILEVEEISISDLD